MKIRLSIIAPFPPPSGGMSVLAYTLKFCLEKKGVIVNTINTNASVPKSLKKYKFKAFYQFFVFSIELYKIFKSDIVFIISSSGWSFYVKVLPALIICKIINKDVILDFVGGGMLLKLNSLNVSLLKLFKHILVPTRLFKQAFNECGIKCQIFPHIVNINRFKSKKNQNGKIVLLSAKALEEYSGIENLIKSFSIVKKEYNNAEFIIAGEGSEKTKLENLVYELQLSGVEFIGNVKYDNMPLLHQKAKIFIHGTKVESFGIALVEAMASGTPIVSTNVGGIPDVIDDNENGYLVDYGDYKTMAERILTLLNDKELYDKFYENGLVKAEKFGYSQLSNKLILIIKTILNKP